MEADSVITESPATFGFRPAKRRKVFRQRPAAESDSERETPAPISPTAAVAAVNSSESSPAESQDEGISLAEVLRKRKAAQRRKGGVEFSSSTPQPQTSIAAPPAPVQATSENLQPTSLIHSRFAAPTGQAADVDKHIYAASDMSRIAYIETEIAKQRDSTIQPIAGSNSRNENGQLLSETGALLNSHQRQPASLGKLHEIDLGVEAKRRNIERTQAAVQGRPSEPEEKDEPVRLRLCRDGKYRPRRRRKRRNSEDIKRDQIVEDILRESNLGIYDAEAAKAAAADMASSTTTTAAYHRENDGDEKAADDEIAEQFRKDFLEAVAMRQAQQRKQKKTTTKKGEGKERSDDKIGGPKLGGSRSQRAAMHARQVKEKQAEREAGRL